MFNHSIGASSARRLRRELTRKLAQAGIWGTVKSGPLKIVREMRKLVWAQRQITHPFDVKYGTDTGGIIEASALDIADDKVAHANRYQTAIVEVFTGILKDLSIRHEEFLFIDLGSGKGRALLLASEIPFKEIVGVELSPNLHRIACRNIEIYRDEWQRCRKIRSVCQDAASYQIPPEKAVFYLFNPFDAYVMRALLANIEDSLRNFPREIYILYLKPVYREMFDQARFLRIAKDAGKYVIYESSSRSLS